MFFVKVIFAFILAITFIPHLNVMIWMADCITNIPIKYLPILSIAQNGLNYKKNITQSNNFSFIVYVYTSANKSSTSNIYFNTMAFVIIAYFLTTTISVFCSILTYTICHLFVPILYEHCGNLKSLHQTLSRQKKMLFNVK